MRTSCRIAVVTLAALAAAAQPSCIPGTTITITNTVPGPNIMPVASTGLPSDTSFVQSLNTAPTTSAQESLETEEFESSLTKGPEAKGSDDIFTSSRSSTVSTISGLKDGMIPPRSSRSGDSTSIPSRNEFSATKSHKAETTPVTTVTVTIMNTISVTALDAASITSAPEAGNTLATSGSGGYMTIAMTNKYGSHISVSFGSNVGAPSPVGNPSATSLPENGFTQYSFPTGWAGRIYLGPVGPELNPDGSKIEGSFTGPPDIDVSYVDGYSVPVTCSSQGTAVSGCNIDLFKQSGIQCNNQVDGPVCLNAAQNIPSGPAPDFFAACAGAAYTYPQDDKANAADLNSTLVSCCVGTSCKAPSRQRTKEIIRQPIRIRAIKAYHPRQSIWPYQSPSLPKLQPRHWQRFFLERYF